MRVVLDINEKYGNVLTLTAIGAEFPTVKVSTHAMDLTKVDYVVLDEHGNWQEVPNERQMHYPLR